MTGIHRKAAIRLLRRPPRPRTAPSRAGRPRAVRSGRRRRRRGAVAGQWPDRRPSAAPLRARAPRPAHPVRRPGPRSRASTRSCARSAAPRSPACWRPPAPRPRRAACRPPGPAPGSSTRSPSAPSPSGTTRAPASARSISSRTVGAAPRGFYLCTLCAVDIATSWVELEAVWGKGQQRVGAAIHHVRERLPVPLVGLDSDNGSEFINHALYAWCQRARDHLHPQPRLEEERQCPRRAEERRGRPAAHRL